MWQCGERNVPKRKKRDMEPYPALKRELNLRSRQDLIDYDYLHKLNPEEKEWLNKFTNEYVVGKMDREEPENNIHPAGKDKVVAQKETKTMKKSYKSDTDWRNDLRKEDAYTRSKAGNHLNYLEDFKRDIVIENYEDFLINELDKMPRKKKKLNPEST